MSYSFVCNERRLEMKMATEEVCRRCSVDKTIKLFSSRFNNCRTAVNLSTISPSIIKCVCLIMENGRGCSDKIQLTENYVHIVMNM